MTINDLVTACLATGIKQYFESKGDKHNTKKINIGIPGNIRFGPYESWKDVKFENKFAPMPIVVPLENDIKKSLEVVPRYTS